MRAAPAPWRTTGTSSGSSTPPSAPSPSGGFSGSIQPTRLTTPPKGEGPSPSTVGGLRCTRSGRLVNRDTGAIGHPDRITSMKAAIYARISLDRDGTYIKVENQLGPCHAFVGERGWEVGQVFVDNDLSATSGAERPEFEALLRSQPEVIVVWHLDRLIRRMDDLERVIALGVNVHAIKAGHIDLSTPAGRAVSRTVTAWATYEGEQKAERMKLANRARAAKGVPQWSLRPFGYHLDGQVNEDEAPWVKQIASWIIHEGISLNDIARRLNEAGVPTTVGGKWQGRTVRQLIINPRNAGLRTYHGEVMGEGVWEPLLTMEEWESVRHRLELNRRPYKGTGTRKYLLSGIVECGICGANMTGGMGAKEKPIYSCRPNHCMYRSAALLDDVVSEVVCAVLSGAGALSGQSPTGDIERLRERRTEARRRMDEAAEAFAQGAITLKQLTSINEWCQRDLEDLDREVAKYETTPTLSRL